MKKLWLGSILARIMNRTFFSWVFFSFFLALLPGPAALAIHGGENVQDDDPIAHHTLFLFSPSGGKSFSGCSATIIDKNWLLTAAHCVINKNTGAVVDFLVATSNDGNLDLDSSRIVPHPDYDNVAFSDDLALISFKNNLSSPYSPAQIARRTPGEGDSVTAAGYGLGSEKGQLKKVNLTLGSQINENQMNWDNSCSRGVDHGDSGGSVYFGGALAGVISHSHGNNSPDCNNMNFSMSVLSYRGWIESTMGHALGSSSGSRNNDSNGEDGND